MQDIPYVFSYLFCKDLFANSKSDRERGEERETERELFPLARLLSKYLQKPELHKAKARSQELHPIVPHEWPAPKYLDHYVLPPKYVSRLLGQKCGISGTCFVIPIWDVGISSSSLTYCTTTPMLVVRFRFRTPERVDCWNAPP